MARRTGIPTLHWVARRMCALLAKYSDVIAVLYPENADLLAALALAETACTALKTQLALVRDYGD